MVTHVFDSSTKEAEAGGLMSLRPNWVSINTHAHKGQKKKNPANKVKMIVMR